MTQPINIIQRALINIGALAIDGPIESVVANYCFDMLNDMLDQWTAQKMMIFCVQDVIHEIVPNQAIYKIGPNANADVVAQFTASIVGNVLAVSAMTSGAISVGMTVNGSGVPAGTIITALGTGQGGSGSGAVGNYFVNTPGTLFAPSTAMNAWAQRPLRINSAFARITTSGGPLDYPVSVFNVENYEIIGLKSLPGPWPTALYYQPSMPVGIITYWPVPTQGEMHLFCDTLLLHFQTINDTITLPPGYESAMRWGLAELLMPTFPVASGLSAEVRALVPKYAEDARAYIKRINMQPQQTARFDPALNLARSYDAGWIMHGGFL